MPITESVAAKIMSSMFDTSIRILCERNSATPEINIRSRPHIIVAAWTITSAAKAASSGTPRHG